MSGVKDQILKVIMQPQMSVLATLTEEGKPWARYVMTFGNEGMEIRFSTFVTARKVQQIGRNPEVHLTCGVTNPDEMKPYLQIQGRARFTTERAERHGFWVDRLKTLFSGPDDPKYGIVVVTPYRIECWNPGCFTPEVWTAED